MDGTNRPSLRRVTTPFACIQRSVLAIFTRGKRLPINFRSIDGRRGRGSPLLLSVYRRSRCQSCTTPAISTKFSWPSLITFAARVRCSRSPAATRRRWVRSSATSLFLGRPAARRNAAVSPNRTSSVARDRRPFPLALRAPTGCFVAPRNTCRSPVRRLAADLTTLILFCSYTFDIPQLPSYLRRTMTRGPPHARTFVSLSFARLSCHLHCPYP